MGFNSVFKGLKKVANGTVTFVGGYAGSGDAVLIVT